MPENENLFDRMLRVFLGLAMILIVSPKASWGYVGFLPLLTGLAGYCPLYHLFGVTTCGSAEGRAKSA